MLSFMGSKIAKAKRPERLFPYDHEDLAPETLVAAEAKTDAFEKSNREEVNAALAEARDDMRRGAIYSYDSLDDLYADIVAEGRRRRASKV